MGRVYAEGMKKTCMVVGALLALTLTGCDVQTIEEVKQEAEFAKVCRDHGGEPYYTGFGFRTLQCDLGR